MSTDDEIRTGRSNDSIHNAIVYTVPVALQIGLNLIPEIGLALDVLQAISLFVDLYLDPRGFDTTYSRDSIDTICSDQTNALKNALFTPEYLEAVETSIKTLSPSITPDQLARETLIATAWYKQKLIYAPISCYSDLINPDATGLRLAASMSGPPTDNCPDIYAEPYNAYVTENKVKYEADKITNSNLIVEASNNATRFSARNKIKADRALYTTQFVIIGLLFTISLVTVISLFLIQRKREKSL
jgi:hypothetical protein